MRIKCSVFLAMLAISGSVMASTVAIVDSGVDFNHPELAGRAWVNPLELDNDLDDDNNGYLNDFNGWNFVLNNNQLINQKYMPLVYDADVRRAVKILSGVTKLEDICPSDRVWLKDMVNKRPTFAEDIETFGGLSHGTHVAGIAAKGNNADIMGIKFIPSNPNEIAERVADETVKMYKGKKGLKAWIMEKVGRKIAESISGENLPMLNYLKDKQVDIANGSYGTGYPQVQQIAELLLNKISVIFKPNKKDIDRVARGMMDELIKRMRVQIKDVPNTLFVYAAGNDGLNNDVYPSSPSNIKTANSIAVAATDGFDSLASFSNYGKKKVDVAAPGVNIESSIPGGDTFEMSGTSQAAPYVTNVATRVKDANPKLTPSMIKKIIIDTVTKKEFLKNKVVSGGIVNWERAEYAAKLSVEMPLDEAIKKANEVSFPLSMLE